MRSHCSRLGNRWSHASGHFPRQWPVSPASPGTFLFSEHVYRMLKMFGNLLLPSWFFHFESVESIFFSFSFAVKMLKSYKLPPMPQTFWQCHYWLEWWDLNRFGRWVTARRQWAAGSVSTSNWGLNTPKLPPNMVSVKFITALGAPQITSQLPDTNISRNLRLYILVYFFRLYCPHILINPLQGFGADPSW